MSYSFLAQDRAFQAAQRAHDNRLPPEPADRFLDTEEGGKWLRETAEHVSEGGKFKAGSALITFDCVVARMRETENEFWVLFADAATEYALSPTDARYQAKELAQMDMRKAAVAVAIELIAPHADTWAEEQRREQEDYL